MAAVSSHSTDRKKSSLFSSMFVFPCLRTRTRDYPSSMAYKQLTSSLVASFKGSNFEESAVILNIDGIDKKMLELYFTLTTSKGHFDED